MKGRDILSLQDHLYTANTVQDVLEGYIKELLEKGDLNSKAHANKWKSCQNLMNDRQFTKSLRKFFNETYNMLEKKHSNLQFSISGRRKPIISTERKILQRLNSGDSLDLICDFYAFRIILFADDSLDLTLHCYKVIEDIIDLAISKGYLPCQRLPLVGVNDIHDNKNPYFSEFKYKHFVKDYICFPKENGYQSIHLVLTDTKGRKLEIQVRTLAMHAQIESGIANHADYKKSRYTSDFDLDREKIKIVGYSYLNNQVFDYSGIEEPVVIFARQKIF